MLAFKLFEEPSRFTEPKRFTVFHKKQKFTILDKDEASTLVFAAERHDQATKLKDFCITHVLGTGVFGKVYLGEIPSISTEKYAIKCIRKDKLVERNAIDSAFTELEILKNADHVFLTKLQFFFQTDERFYFVTPFVGGGKLSLVLEDADGKKFTEKQIKFYIVQLILGLEYLHTSNIMHRSLKIENLLLDETGYLKIVDFGMAKVYRQQYTVLCDKDEEIAAYFAPELIKGEGYSFASDWWAVGIIMYQMLVGFLPFHSKNKNTFKRQVIEHEAKFPH